MAITTVFRNVQNEVTREKVSYAGRVIEIRNYHATRNHSDTLDYTDMRGTDCVDALVYVGRKVPEDFKGSFYSRAINASLKAGDHVPLEARFTYEDCTNLFAWRNGCASTPVVDADFAANPGMAEDLAAWRELQEKTKREAAALQAKRDAEEKARKEEAERNRPVVGKRMEVFKGRKVPIGTTGTVAYVHYNGGVLLKNDNEWQNRKANGVWVNREHLRLAGPCTLHEDCRNDSRDDFDLGRCCAEGRRKPVVVK